MITRNLKIYPDRMFSYRRLSLVGAVLKYLVFAAFSNNLFVIFIL